MTAWHNAGYIFRIRGKMTFAITTMKKKKRWNTSGRAFGQRVKEGLLLQRYTNVYLNPPLRYLPLSSTTLSSESPNRALSFVTEPAKRVRRDNIYRIELPHQIESTLNSYTHSHAHLLTRMLLRSKRYVLLASFSPPSPRPKRRSQSLKYFVVMVFKVHAQ